MTYETLITKEDICRRLCVSLACLDRWIRERRIPIYRLGKKCIRFDYAEVRQALEKYEVSALRRFPRPVYRIRKRQVRHPQSIQLPLPLTQGDPDQAVFFFLDTPPRAPTPPPDRPNATSIRD